MYGPRLLMPPILTLPPVPLWRGVYSKTGGLRERIDDIRMDLAFDVAILMVMPTVLVALYLLLRVVSPNPPSSWVAVALVLGIAAFVACWTRKLLRADAEMDKLRKGLDAEMAVGQELDQLIGQGARVFHDLPAETFNIDHIVVSRQGVFCVETKGYTKPLGLSGAAAARVEFDGHTLRFPDFQTSKPVEQAARQAQWLSQWLSSALGSPISAIPVLALPGWYVELKQRGAVRVFSGKALGGGLLKAGSPIGLSDQDMQRITHEVDQRCRNVKPTYRPAGDV
jgi:hypothetical protein